MLYSLNLLKKYITINDSPENVGRHLTLKTCEIEKIESRILPDDLVIGKVLSTEKHDNADLLIVCQVDCGQHGTKQIITGGENVKAGTFVPVALPGCHLPVIDLTIKDRMLKGKESSGMICSKEELGIKEDMDQHRIRILQHEKPLKGDDFLDITNQDIGVSLKTKFPRLENVIFDVDNKTITNRPDLTGHFGLSIELHTIYDLLSKRNNQQYYTFNTLTEQKKIFEHSHISEILSNASPSKKKITSSCDALYSYVLLEINTITIQQSSLFTRLMLLDLGVTPHNNRVDFSNIFMLSTGQPIHFFDADKIDGDIVVRYANEGESFLDLTNKEHALTTQDIVIADSKKILALAGIIGGIDSCVDENTKNLIVEIANFDPVILRKTAKRLSLRTEASMRFEKSINPVFSLYMILFFMNEISYFAKDLGEHSLGGSHRYANSQTHTLIDHNISLGWTISHTISTIYGQVPVGFYDLAPTILQNLGFTIQTDLIIAPYRRSPKDISIALDIDEEIARIRGYENIPTINLPAQHSSVDMIPQTSLIRTLEQLVVERLHYDQIETYPWINTKHIEMLGLSTENFFSLDNYLNPDQVFFRTSMITQFLDVVAKNYRSQPLIRIAEISKTFHTDLSQPEQRKLGMLISSQGNQARNQDNFLQGKGDVEIILSHLNKQNYRFEPSQNQHYHPQKQCNIIIDDHHAGTIGQVDPLITELWKIPLGNTTYIEINISHLLNVMNHVINYKPYQSLSEHVVERDLGFLLPIGNSYQQIIEILSTSKEISSYNIFDLYQGTKISDDQKYIGIRFSIRSEKAYTTEDINTVMNILIKKITSVGATLRTF